jgi:hypothetical protein
VKPHFINACCFGEDFAAWLKPELSLFVVGSAETSVARDKAALSGSVHL